MSKPEPSIDDLLPAIGTAVLESEESGAELNTGSGVLQILHGELVDRIEMLLKQRRELLMSLLYRVDVDESLVVDAFRNRGRDKIASRLADLILERQVQKVRSRRAHRNRNH